MKKCFTFIGSTSHLVQVQDPRSTVCPTVNISTMSPVVVVAASVSVGSFTETQVTFTFRLGLRIWLSERSDCKYILRPSGVHSCTYEFSDGC